MGIAVKDVTSPFEFGPPERMGRFLDVMEGNANAAFSGELSRLEKHIISTNPLHLLSTMSVYHMFHDVGVILEKQFSDPLIQFHLEWLQGICLRYPMASYASPGRQPKILGAVTESLKRIPVISVVERWQRALAERDATGDPDSWQQELARIERLAIRNWAYPDLMVTTVAELCAGIEVWSQAEFGYSLAIVPTLFSKMVAEVEERYNVCRRAAQDVLGPTKSSTGFAIRWKRSSLPGAEQVPKLMERVDRGDLTPRGLVEEFVANLEDDFVSFFTFRPKDLCSLSGSELTEDQARTLLDEISWSFGDLADTPIQHFTLGNPVWIRPLIRLGDDQFFCPIPVMLLSHVLDIVESLVVDRNPDVWWNARSDYLEHKTVTLFRSAFPSGMIYERSKWRDPGDEATVYENDLAAVVGNVVLVGEAKSHRITAAARRGSPDGLRTTIDNLVVEASEQSERFSHYLLEPRGDKSFFRNGTEEFAIDSTNVASAVRANVILDSFAVTGSSTPSLRTAGLLRNDDPDPAPTFLVTDLQSVFELLPDELQRLHYMTRRSIIQRRLTFEADEIDLLAYYIETGFNSPEFEVIDKPIILRGLSWAVDPYLEARFAGRRAGVRPSRAIHPRYEKLLAGLPSLCPRNSGSAGIALLDASSCDQLRMLEEQKAATKVAKRAADGMISMWRHDVGISPWNSTVAGVVGAGLSAMDADQKVREAVERLEPSPISQIVAMCFDPLRSKTAPFAIQVFEV